MSRISASARHSDVSVLEARNRQANNRMISHLNIRVDFLQQKTRDMENKLKDSTMRSEKVESKLIHYKSENEELNSRNDELLKDINDIECMAKMFQSDNDLAVKTADRETLETKTKLMKSRQDVDSLQLTVAQLEAENKRFSVECKETKSVLGKKQGDVLRLEELLDRVQEDKRRLGYSVNILVANEKELVLENDRLKRKNGPVSGKKGKIPSKLDAFIRNVEGERNYYRDQNEALQKILRRFGDIPPRCASPVRSRPSSRSGSPVRRTSATRTDTKNIAYYETSMRILEEERDFYRKEYEVLKAVKKSFSSNASTNMAVTEDPDVERLTRERDEMRILLNNLESHMVEIQTNVNVVTSERDELNEMYEKTKEELQKARIDIVKSPKKSLAAQAVLCRLENERDDALSDLRRITTDRDNLRERQKATTESFIVERTKQEQRIESLEANLNAIDARRRELLEQMMRMKDANRDLEERMSGLDQANTFTKDELSQLRATISLLDREKDALQSAVDELKKKEIRLNVDLLQKEKEIDDLNMRTNETDAQLVHSSDTLKTKEHELENLLRQLNCVTGDLNESSRAKEIVILENGRLRLDLVSSTRDKQKLNQEVQNGLEEKESLQTKIRRAEDLLSNKGKEHSDLLERCRTLSDEIERLQAEIDQLESEKSNMQHEIITKDSELCDNKEKVHNLEKEIRELNFVFDDIEQETELLHTQLNSEKALVKNLEETLNANQEKEFQSQLTIQEKNSEVQMLKDTLLLNESNIQRQNREIVALKTGNAKLEADVQRYKMATENSNGSEARSWTDMNDSNPSEKNKVYKNLVDEPNTTPENLPSD